MAQYYKDFHKSHPEPLSKDWPEEQKFKAEVLRISWKHKLYYRWLSFKEKLWSLLK